MPLIDAARRRLRDATMRYFPPHSFSWHRAEENVVFTLGTGSQLMSIGGAAALLGWLSISTASIIQGNATGEAAVAAKTAELTQMQTQLAVMKSNSVALEGVVATRAAAIEARQRFLAQLLLPRRDLGKLAALLPRGGDAADARQLVAPRYSAPQASAMLEPFRRLESQQLAFVDKATAAAITRLKDTQTLVRSLGLDPERLVAQSSYGTGGPYIPVAAPADAEPRFKNLYLSWKKLEVLETAMAAVPAYMPVRNFNYTSGFGVRSDPFNGSAAMHTGLDMAGAMGEPIYAAASGTVVTAGRSNGYGNLVELAHGRGLATRYGHLSKILVHSGEQVKQGEMIARMGSTGRSTGTHLHFEVRIDGRAVNPRPYLEASSFMLAAQSHVSGPPAEVAVANFVPDTAVDRFHGTASAAGY